MSLKHWLAFFALIALGLALGRLKPEPVALIEDVHTTEPVELDLTPADWQRCAPEPRAPLTTPGPGKAHFDYRTRDGGQA